MNTTKPKTSESVRNGGAITAIALAVIALINASVPVFNLTMDPGSLAAFNAAILGVAVAVEAGITKWQRDRVFAPETVEWEKDLREEVVNEGPPEDGTTPYETSLAEILQITEPYPDNDVNGTTV